MAHDHHHHHHTPRATAEPPPTGDAGTIYTCPMHPEVRQAYPGNCPKCGMALEPVVPKLQTGESPELRDFRRRFWWTLPLTIAVTTLAMFGHQFHWFELQRQSWIELALSLPIVLWAGSPFFARGWQSVLNRSPNMWTLISLGTGAAFCYSVVATMAPGAVPGLLHVDGSGRRVFRSGRCDHHADAAGAAAGAAGSFAGVGGHPVAARSRPQNRAAHPPGRHGGRHRADACSRRRSAAHPSWRKSADRRHRDRGQQRDRRVHADGRADCRSAKRPATRSSAQR